jgi:MFS family permease
MEGLFLASYNLGGIFLACWIGKKLHVWGKKRALVVAHFVISLSFFAMALLHFVETRMHFFLFAVMLRFVQGLAALTVRIAIRSYVVLQTSDENRLAYLG